MILTERQTSEDFSIRQLRGNIPHDHEASMKAKLENLTKKIGDLNGSTHSSEGNSQVDNDAKK